MLLNEDKLLKSSYLNMGCKRIIPELFCPPSASQNVYSHQRLGSFKPTGGFWMTKDVGHVSANDWLVYMAIQADGGNDSLLYNKFSPNIVTVTLKEDAQILIPKTIIDLMIIKEMFPVVIDRKHSNNNFINYAKLSKKYDGIYISESLVNNSQLSDWCVPSLVIFNYKVIDSYKSSTIEKYFGGCWLFDEIYSDPEIRKVPSISGIYLEVLEKFNELYIKMIQNELNKFSCNHYAEFVENISNIFDRIVNENKELFDYLANTVIPNALGYKESRSPYEEREFRNRVYYSLNSKLRSQNNECLNDIYMKSLKR